MKHLVMSLLDLISGEACVANNRPAFLRLAMHEFGAGLDGQKRAGGTQRVNSSANAVARFNHFDSQSRHG